MLSVVVVLALLTMLVATDEDARETNPPANGDRFPHHRPRPPAP
jgi:hypothetical protein